jgi:hypothetical protein
MLAPDAFDALLRDLENTADEYWNVGRDNAKLLALPHQKRETRAASSKSGPAMATRRCGSPARSEEARARRGPGRRHRVRPGPGRPRPRKLRQSGLDHVIMLREGDARSPDRLPSLPGRPSISFFWTRKKASTPIICARLLPLVRSGGLLVGDDTLSLRAQMDRIRRTRLRGTPTSNRSRFRLTTASSCRANDRRPVSA